MDYQSSNKSLGAEKLKVIVVQTGARRDYELPRMLDGLSLLHSFHTTTAIHESEEWQFVAKLRHIPGLNAQGGMRRRRVRGIKKEKLFSHFRPDVVRKLTGFFTGENGRPKWIQNELLGYLIPTEHLKRSNALYSVDGDGGIGLFRRAKKLQLKIITEIIIHPRHLEILKEELSGVDFEKARNISQNEIAMERDHYQLIARYSDMILCPSEYVAEGMAEIFPEVQGKIEIVPYGRSGYPNSEMETAPVPGRVLFVGNDGTRKGLHYLADAAARLSEELPFVQVVVAGTMPSTIVEHPRFSSIRFLGKLDRQQLQEEYLKADMLCLPSLVEGSAGVVLESLGFGIPVIVTRSAGAPITDDQHGFVVQERDSDSIFVAVSRIASDRHLRRRLSENAKQLAGTFDEATISKQLERCFSRLACAPTD